MENSTKKTYQIAKIVSVYFFVTGLGFLLSGDFYESMISHTGTDPVLINLSGMVHFFIGMTIIVNHFRWRKPLQVVVTLSGFMYLLKGVLLIALPELTLQTNDNPAQNPAMLSYIWMAIGLVYAYFAFFGSRREKK